MKQPRHKLAQYVADQSLKSGVSKRLSRELAAYLLVERRTGELESLLRDVQADWAKAGHLEVLAVSAHPLTPAVRSQIRSRLKALQPSAKQIIITEVHDPTVVGGLRLELPDRQLDMSVAAKLNRFKQLTKKGSNA